MKYLMHNLPTICLIFLSLNLKIAKGTESITLEPSEAFLTTIIPQDIKLEKKTEAQKVEVKAEQRSIDFHGSLDAPTHNEDRHAAFRKRAKPLKSIFMGIYKNYKSTYMGNKTLAEYRNAMRLRKEKEKEDRDDENFNKAQIETTETYPAAVDEYKETEAITEKEIELNKHNELEPKTDEAQKPMSHKNGHGKSRNSKKKRKKQRLRRTKHASKPHEETKEETSKSPTSIYRYDFGHGYNMSLDMTNDIVKLNLDAENLKEIMQGRFFKDASEGRGKKNEMITRVLPLFIIPFLIQSAIVPFLITKLKLLLMKSILVGKLAIFLLVLSAIRNSNKMMQTYEVAPSYWAGEPSRRSELAAAASSAAYNGYRVEGKPAAWIN